MLFFFFEVPHTTGAILFVDFLHWTRPVTSTYQASSTGSVHMPEGIPGTPSPVAVVDRPPWSFYIKDYWRGKWGQQIGNFTFDDCLLIGAYALWVEQVPAARVPPGAGDAPFEYWEVLQGSYKDGEEKVHVRARIMRWHEQGHRALALMFGIVPTDPILVAHESWLLASGRGLAWGWGTPLFTAGCRRRGGCSRASQRRPRMPPRRGGSRRRRVVGWRHRRRHRRRGRG